MKLKRMLVALLLGVMSLSAWAEGQSWKKAGSISVGKSRTVRLVAEVDDDGDETGYGVYYLKFTGKRYSAYTVYTTGVTDDSGIDMSVEDLSSFDWDLDDYYVPSFSGSQDSDGNYRYILYSDDWDEDCRKDGAYYIVLSGEVGDPVTVTVVNGVEEEPITWGTSEHPKAITVTDAGGGSAGRLMGGEYYFSAKLVEGKKYKFWTEGGTEEETLSLSVDTEEEGMEVPDIRSLTAGVTDGNDGFILVPGTTGPHVISVSGDGAQPFTLKFGAVAARTPANHAATGLEIGSSAEINPGRRNQENSGFFDQVIDETLCKVSLAAGAMYAFETEGADTGLTMELYDAAGTVLARNFGMAASNDCRIVFKSPKKADYYIGVCQTLEDDENDEVTAGPCRVSARLTAPGDGVRDAWDTAGEDFDATYAGATGVDAFLGSSADDVVAVGTSAGVRTLGLTDFCDTYRFDARNGMVYKFAVVLDESVREAMSTLVLTGAVYTISGTRKVYEKDLVFDDLLKGGQFTAKVNGSYYLEVGVKNGQGVDYGPYELRSMVYASDGSKPGKLEVRIGGATFSEGASWKITAPVIRGVVEPNSPGDAIVPVPAGTYTVAFSTVKNWTTPAPATVVVKSGETSTIDVKYNDVQDDAKNDAALGDGSMTGKKLTKLTPAVKPASVSRSLWKDDLADWYKFDIKVNSRYFFKLEDSNKLGDAEIVVYRSNGTDVVARGRDASFLCREQKGTYWVCVTHAGSSPADSQYAMTYSMKQVGAIGFAKGALSVKDTATSVALTVNRANGKDGRVRVRYATRAGSAQPGVNYVPQSGFLEWAENDSKAKTITIGLLGDLRAKWEEDRSFAVDLANVSFESVEPDEFMPVLGVSTATVTIQDATKMKTGVVSFTGWGRGDEAFVSATKPVASCSAGEPVRLRLSRSNGHDGRIAVTVAPKKGTALPGTDFDDAVQTVVWENGDEEDKYVVVETYPTEAAYAPTKTFSLKLASDKSLSPYAASKLGAAVTVSILDPNTARTFDDYAAEAKAGGLAVKTGKADTWYIDSIGMLRSVVPAAGGSVSLTLGFSGPGKFAFTPVLVKDDGDPSVVSCLIGKEKVALRDGEDVVRYLGKGAQSVTFTVSRDRTSKSDVYLAFAPQGSGAPFVVKTLPTPALVSPLAMEVAAAHEGEIGEVLDFCWTSVEDDEVAYLFTLDSNAKMLGTPAAKFCGNAESALSEAKISVPVDCATCSKDGFEPPGTLVAGKTYFWRVDTAFVEDGAIKLVNTNATWSVTPTTGETARPLARGRDASGKEIVVDGVPVGTAYPVELVQGLSCSFVLEGENLKDGSTVTYALAKGSTLPAGLALKNGVISGIPGKIGKTTSVIQIFESVKGVAKATAGATLALAFTVQPAGLAAGTFNGVLESEDDCFVENAEGYLPVNAGRRLAGISFSATEAGKLSAKVTIGSSSTSFSGTGWTESVQDLGNGESGLRAELPLPVKFTVGKTSVTCTNLLTVTACRGATNSWDALDCPLEVSLSMNFLASDKLSVVSNVVYSGLAVRDNSKVVPSKAAMADFTGYYTAALALPDADSEAPQGYGTLTMTVANTGVAKLAAVLPDGTTVSASATGSYRSLNDRLEPEYRVPFYYAKGNVVFGGFINVVLVDGVPVVSAETELAWINGDAASTYSGEQGFAMPVVPVGGYYDTLVNLQTYYLDYAFRIQELDVWSLPEELLGSQAAYVAYPGLFPEYLSLVGSTLSIAKQQKKMRADNSKLIDWENSINPANQSLTFKAATGLYTGSFDLWAGDGDSGEETKQVKIGSYKTKGVLILNRDPATAVLPFEEGVMPGFYLAPVKLTTPKARTWNASLPFLIVPEAVESDGRWDEGLPE